jgi:hypothetical protein
MQDRKGEARSSDDSTVPASTNAVSVARLQVIVETVAGDATRREIVLEDDCFRVGRTRATIWSSTTRASRASTAASSARPRAGP